MKDAPEDLTQIPSDPTEVFVTEVAGKMRRGSLTASLDTERVNDNLEVLVGRAREEGLLVRDRFVLLDQLGAGGMGTVFTAIDLRRAEADDPNSRVAIKFLSSAFSEHPDALVSLQREARKTQ